MRKDLDENSCTNITRAFDNGDDLLGFMTKVTCLENLDQD
jgi:hypothetical protein